MEPAKVIGLRIAMFLQVWVLLLRHGASRSPEGHPRIAPGYFTLKALLLYPPHIILTRFNGRDSYVIFLIPKTVD